VIKVPLELKIKIKFHVSIVTLQRWKRILGKSTNYELLIPNYHYEDYSRTTLTEFEKQIFLKLLLHPNKFSME
jgi:hypothetical protein